MIHFMWLRGQKIENVTRKLGRLGLIAIPKAGIGGARRDRTADLLHAMQALSHLSYSPFIFQITLI